MKEQQYNNAIDICASVYDMSKKRVKEIVAEEKKDAPNTALKHVFRTAIALMIEQDKEANKGSYNGHTFESAAMIDGKKSHASIISSKNTFLEVLNGKQKNGYTNQFKRAAYFIEEKGYKI